MWRHSLKPSLRSSSALHRPYADLGQGGRFASCRRGAERPISLLPMKNKRKNAAQSTLPETHHAIPSFHGGMTHGRVEPNEATVQGQPNGWQQSRRSRRLHEQTEQGTWDNSQPMSFDSHIYTSYNNLNNITSSPYMTNQQTMTRNPINNAANFGWGAIYTTPHTSYQTPTAPVMQQPWLQMQSAQQMTIPQPMLGHFGSSQPLFTTTNPTHHRQIRHMSTNNSSARQRLNYLQSLRKKMYNQLNTKHKTDEFLKPVELPPDHSDSPLPHPIDTLRRDMWLAVPEKYKTDELRGQFNEARFYTSRDGNSIETISIERETRRLLLAVREARQKEYNSLSEAERRRLERPGPNVLVPSEERRYVRDTSSPPPIPMPSAARGASISKKDEADSSSVPIKFVSRPVEPPMVPQPLNSYLEQAAKEPIDLHFMQPLLVILDLNGTLLYRKRKAFPPKFVRRPALNYFLERLTSRHEVMVWSSSKQETVDAICEQIFSDVQKKKLVATWSRSHLDLTKEQFNSKVQVYKVLEKVWASTAIQSKFPHKKTRSGKAAYNALRYAPGLDERTEMTGFLNKRWDQSNTVLIDDSLLKAAANPYNIIQVPEFTNVPNDNDTTVLKELLMKIRLLAKSNDVSRRLRSLGPEGIQLRREDVIASASESEADAEFAKQREKESEAEAAKEAETKVVGPNEVFDTENQIVPISLPEPAMRKKQKKHVAAAERKARKEAKREAQNAKSAA